MDLVVRIGPDGRYLDANDALLETTGYELHELQGLPVGALSGISLVDPVEAAHALREGGVPFEPGALVLLLARDGSLVPARFLAAVQHEAGGIEIRVEAVRDDEPDLQRPFALQRILEAWRQAGQRVEEADGETRLWWVNHEAGIRELYRRVSEQKRDGNGRKRERS